MKNNYWAKRIDEQNTVLCDKSIEQTEAKLAKMYIQALERTIVDISDLYDKISNNKEGVPRLNDIFVYDRYFKIMNTLNKRLVDLGGYEIKVYNQAFLKLYNQCQEVISKESPSIVSNTEINVNAARTVIDSVWCADGKHWSDRVWHNKELLQSTLEKGLMDCVARGVNKDELIKQMGIDFNISFNQASRIVRTELAHIQNQACLDRYTAAGFKYFKIKAIIDDRTSEDCAELDGQVFPIERMVPGDMLPPYHPNCRCSIYPVYRDDN